MAYCERDREPVDGIRIWRYDEEELDCGARTRHLVRPHAQLHLNLSQAKFATSVVEPEPEP